MLFKLKMYFFKISFFRGGGGGVFLKCLLKLSEVSFFFLKHSNTLKHILLRRVSVKIHDEWIQHDFFSQILGH